MSKIKWMDWNPRRVVAAVAAATARNMELACKVAELSGKANLRAISTPESGRAYRQKVLAPRVSFEVEVGTDFVEGRVGILKGRHDTYHGAYYIEIGTRRYPAHPWLRPAVFGNAREIVRIISGG